MDGGDGEVVAVVVVVVVVVCGPETSMLGFSVHGWCIMWLGGFGPINLCIILILALSTAGVREAFIRDQETCAHG